MEIRDSSEALSKTLAQISPELEEVESIHRAGSDAAHVQTALTDPKVF